MGTDTYQLKVVHDMLAITAGDREENMKHLHAKEWIHSTATYLIIAL